VDAGGVAPRNFFKKEKGIKSEYLSA